MVEWTDNPKLCGPQRNEVNDVLCPDCRMPLRKEFNMPPEDTLVCNHCQKGIKVCHSILYVSGYWDGYKKAQREMSCCHGFFNLFGTHRPGCKNDV